MLLLHRSTKEFKRHFWGMSFANF
ncbi:unnamed protein product [Victoria cruziana]